MSELLTGIGTLFTQVITWIGSVLTMFVETPILLLFIGLGLVGTAIGFASRLLKR